MEWYESTFDVLAKGISIKALPTSSNYWVDIDCPDDFEKVKEMCEILKR